MQKQKSKVSYRLSMLAILVGLICFGFNQYATAAGTTNNTTSKSTTTQTTTNITQAVTQSYNADSSVDLGMIVELKQGSANTVQALPQGQIKSMLGVAVEQNEATIALTPQNDSHQQVFVATTGRYNVLVSTQNGNIKTGDYITISSLNGIGMRADSDESEIVGKAGTDFDGTADVVGQTKVTNTLGVNKTISIGLIPVNLNVSHNPLESKIVDFVPGFLAKTATAIAAKPVSAARIYLSLVIIVASCILTGNMLYSGVKSGMTAVGRNPLSKKSIIGSLIQTVVAGLIVFVVGIFGVYLLLKL